MTANADLVSLNPFSPPREAYGSRGLAVSMIFCKQANAASMSAFFPFVITDWRVSSSEQLALPSRPAMYFLSPASQANSVS